MVASRQAYELDKTRVRLEANICDMEKESSCRIRERMKLEAEVKELKNLVEELKTDIVEKDTRLDYLQKQNDELWSSLSKSRDEHPWDSKTVDNVLPNEASDVQLSNLCQWLYFYPFSKIINPYHQKLHLPRPYRKRTKDVKSPLGK